MITGNRQPHGNARTWKDRSCSVISATQIPRRARAFPTNLNTSAGSGRAAHSGEPIVHVACPTAQEFGRRRPLPLEITPKTIRLRKRVLPARRDIAVPGGDRNVCLLARLAQSQKLIVDERLEGADEYRADGAMAALPENAALTLGVTSSSHHGLRVLDGTVKMQ